MVSIIITTYNRKELLIETINSILNQTYKNFELLIIDNFSNYDFHSLIDNYKDERIKPYQNHNNGIIAINRNFAINKSQGDFIAFCDDDDIWIPTKLEIQMKIFNKYKCDITSSNINLIDINNKVFFNRRVTSRILFSLISLNFINHKYPIIFFSYLNNSTIVVKKQIFNEIGLINENEKYAGIEDFDLFYKILLRFNLYYTNKKLIYYRIHDSQFSLNNLKREIRSRYNILHSNRNSHNKIQNILVSIFYFINKKFLQ